MAQWSLVLLIPMFRSNVNALYAGGYEVFFLPWCVLERVEAEGTDFQLQIVDSMMFYELFLLREFKRLSAVVRRQKRESSDPYLSLA